MRIRPIPKRGRVVLKVKPESGPRLNEAAKKTDVLLRIRNILVPVDFSECSRTALSYAISFARQFNASLTLLHVVSLEYPVGGELALVDYPAIEKDMRRNAERLLAGLLTETIGQTVPARSLVAEGRPAQQIVETAKQLEMDLIIIATHGYAGLKHVFLGSTAERVVRMAPCPVLTVRQKERDFVAV